MKIVVVLVIDDDESLCAQIKESLEDEDNVVVLTSYSGEDALRLLSKAKLRPGLMPDFMFVDYRMKGMDGSQFISKCREDNELRKIAYTYLTGSKDPGIISTEEVKAANGIIGGEHYMTKGNRTAEELRKAIAKQVSWYRP